MRIQNLFGILALTALMNLFSACGAAPIPPHPSDFCGPGTLYDPETETCVAPDAVPEDQNTDPIRVRGTKATGIKNTVEGLRADFFALRVESPESVTLSSLRFVLRTRVANHGPWSMAAEDASERLDRCTLHDLADGRRLAEAEITGRQPNDEATLVFRGELITGTESRLDVWCSFTDNGQPFTPFWAAAVLTDATFHRLGDPSALRTNILFEKTNEDLAYRVHSIPRACDYPPLVGQLVSYEDEFPQIYFLYEEELYPFDTDWAYGTWFSDTRCVYFYPKEAHVSLPEHLPLRVRPGFLIRISSDPRIYLVTTCGAIRWVEYDSILVSWFGDYWAAWVMPVTDLGFVNYTLGPSITSAAALDPHSFEEITFNQEIVLCDFY